jgi:hypothetical protein
MKEKIIFVITMFICALIFISAQLKNYSTMSPENAILGIIKAAEANNISEYLSYFCDEIKVNLEDQKNKMGKDLFNQLIMKKYKNLMGVAISNKKEIGSHLTNITVEFIFETHDEIKSYLLKKTLDDWKIKMILDNNVV